MGHVDVISNLPDSILHHILSRLDIQVAVRTSVLSKRWERLWASMQFLELSLPDFETQSPDIEASFIRFVNLLLSQREFSSNLHTFRLFCEESYFEVFHHLITSWILYTINHKAKVIEVDACLYRKLPEEIFTSPFLQELILDISGLGIGVAGKVNLPQLKKLHLCGIMSCRIAILRDLMSGCPALEDLVLRMCSIDMHVIPVPQLKYLTIFSGLSTARIETLKAPNLVSLCLDLHGDVLHSANFQRMPFLVDAKISVQGGTGFDAKCSILCALPNVRDLKLRGSAMKDLLRVQLPKCTTFSNLTEFHLMELRECYDSNLVNVMSAHAPNLKNFHLSRTSCCYECGFEMTSDVPFLPCAAGYMFVSRHIKREFVSPNIWHMPFCTYTVGSLQDSVVSLRNSDNHEFREDTMIHVWNGICHMLGDDHPERGGFFLLVRPGRTPDAM